MDGASLLEMEDETVNSSSDVPVNIPDLLAAIKINKTVKLAIKYLRGTKGEDENHPVCVIYDQFFYGIRRVKLLLKELLMKYKRHLCRKIFVAFL